MNMMTTSPEDLIKFDPRLQGPFTCLVAGPTGCGKTQLIFKLKENVDELIKPPIKEIVYCYGQWQKVFEKFKEKVFFHECLLLREQLFQHKSNYTLLLIDDLLDPEDTTLVRDIFFKGSHHNNISVIIITQNLFLPPKDYRTFSLNAHYMVIF